MSFFRRPTASSGARSTGTGSPGARTPPVPTEERAREICLAALARRPYARRELELKLRQKGIGGDIADPVLDRLVDVGLLDDAAFARAFVASRQRSRPRGRRALEQELFQKGVSRDVIQSVLEELVEEENPRDAAERALAPKLRGLARLDNAAARKKASQFLSRRGFDYDTVRTVVDACLNDLSEE